MNKRIRRVKISPELLVSWCVQGNEMKAKVVEGLPADCQIENVSIGGELSSVEGSQNIEITVSHDSFPEVSAEEWLRGGNQSIPEARVVLQAIR